MVKDNQGAKYVSTVNQQIPQGLRTSTTVSYLTMGRTAYDVELDMGSGIKRIYSKALIRIE